MQMGRSSTPLTNAYTLPGPHFERNVMQDSWTILMHYIRRNDVAETRIGLPESSVQIGFRPSNRHSQANTPEGHRSQ